MYHSLFTSAGFIITTIPPRYVYAPLLSYIAVHLQIANSNVKLLDLGNKLPHFRTVMHFHTNKNITKRNITKWIRSMIEKWTYVNMYKITL